MESTFYTNEPVVNMRQYPTHTSKVVSQTIFAEKITIQDKNGDWICIITSDGYTGWVPKSSIIECKKPYEPSLKTSRLASHIYEVKDNEYGPIKILPFGSSLHTLDLNDPRWIKVLLPDGLEGYIQKGDVTFEKSLSHKNELALFSQKFLGLPYTWGGRSSFGYDCSGFIQMLYSQISISLQRDAKQQILDSRFKNIPIEQIQSGDLIFWGKSQETISHVGMSVGEGNFIHSVAIENKPWIRISTLSDPEWIENSPSRLYREIRQLISR
ncbi:MAG: SH3 domain-containing C40 family peptidase [Chlamydiota bacterium]